MLKTLRMATIQRDFIKLDYFQLYILPATNCLPRRDKTIVLNFHVLLKLFHKQIYY